MAPAKPRDRLLSTATALFQREGILAVGANRIVAEADVAPVTLDRQFGGKEGLVASVLLHWSTQSLHWLTDRLDRRGDDARARFAALWDVLEEWFAADDFNGSFAVNASAELRSEPGHPAHKVIASHRMSVRQLLEDLAKAAGAYDAAVLAAQLQVLVDGAVSVAAVDRRPGMLGEVRQLADAALAASPA